MFPHRSGPYCALWKVYEQGEDYNAAIAAFDGFVVMYGYQVALWERLAEACMRQGDIDRAIEILRTVVERSGESAFMEGKLEQWLQERKMRSWWNKLWR
jgi:tetratricopeptide (TPR) repeat protein